MSGCKQSEGRHVPPRFLAGLLCALALLGSCKDTPSKTEDLESAKAVDDAAKTEPATPLDPSLVPSDALAKLQGIELDAEAPCSLTIDTLRPALASIADYRQKLASATSEASAIKLLSELSKDLRARLPAIAERAESDELRRISAELRASLGDLAESLQHAGEAIRDHDSAAAGTTMRRIDNGVANTRSSIEGLIQQCARQ